MMTIGVLATEARKVVVRFMDGRLLKGTTHDFAPNKNEFHLYVRGDERSHAVPVTTQGLKAVFFVRSYEGDSRRQDNNSFTGAQVQGRKMEVEFEDGEVIAGVTMGYNAAKPGFFLIPADSAANNTRVYVLNAAVRKVTWR